MSDALKKITEPFMALSPKKRIVVGTVVGVSLLMFTALIMVANKTDYRPLFSNLSGEDAGEIVKKLKEQKIPYRIEADGKAISVPSDKVYDLRLSLASDGLPQGSGVGFEIFDRKNFGMTEFVQKLNYQRALQGELCRTIAQISGVEQARVHLVMPEKSLFKDEEKPPTASVVLKMKSGGSLRENEVQGIIHLVSSAIEGMDPDKVTVLDSRGKILSRTGPSDPTGKMTSSMLEMQRNYEKAVEERLQTLLDKAVGGGKSVARVNAVFNFKQVEKYEERYDPEATAVRSEQRTEEKNGNSTSASGIPGVQSNLGKTTAPPSASSNQGSKSDETMNYEISRSTARIIEPVGTLAKISVAILVDGKYEAASGSGASAKPKYQPRSSDELQKIEALAKGAVGFSPDRGDQVTVANIPFQDEGGADKESAAGSWMESPLISTVLKYALIGIAFLALLFFVIRPLMAMLRSERKLPGESFVPYHEDSEQLPNQNKAALAMYTMNQLELIEKVKNDPYQTAQILQNWLRQRD